MNHVERFKAVMNFQPVDRLPRVEWAHWWQLTVNRWHTEGLPENLTDAAEIRRYFGLDPYLQTWIPAWDVPNEKMVPHGQPYLRNMDEYLPFREKYLYRIQENWFKDLFGWAALQNRGEAVIWLTLEGFFWLPRVLLGIEPHLYAFYDQPELMHRINQDLADFHIRLLQRLTKVCRPTFMTFAEDMSYNHGPMISRQIFDDFLAPYYRQVVPVLEELDILPIVDSDGDVSELVPWLESVGLRGILPLERQAGVDVNELRRRHGRLLMIGAFDKMVLNRGEAAIHAEFDRLLSAMRSGGFIPSVDHQTSPGVSLEQYRVYLRLLEEYTAKV